MTYQLVYAPWLYGPLAVAGLGLFLLAALGRVPLGYNLRNLAVRWRITILTALAFTLVVSLLTVMLAFVNGMNRLTEGSAQPGNVLVMSEGATDELFSTLAYDNLAEIERQPGVLAYDSTRQMGSREVYIVVNQPVLGDKRRSRYMQVRGLEDPEVSAKVHGLELYPDSQWFSKAGVSDHDEIQAVLGEGAAHELGKDLNKEMLAIGDVFDNGPRRWVVVGILKSGGSTFGSEIWANQGIVGPMFGKMSYTSLVLRTRNADSARQISEYLSTNYKKVALKAQPETEYYSKLSDTNKQFLVAVSFVAIVMAVGGIFGVMNTMFAAISQRTRDIGVMRILGFTRWQILLSFFLESIGIALLGGLIGFALGYLVDGTTTTSMVGSDQGGGKSVVLKMVVDSNVLAVGMIFTLVMGALGGLVPACSAMRLRPLESLR